ncbi:hypothetical protein SEVIR_7G033974v4 [Setaria viridis]|uniref:Reverse transcriptase zinc-binding domain-containing protein n=1 Tax=Setaria viridis TaxID=4556 RepID=A0A4U6TYJ1_SETVI|nr:hypothetical protein SEVIR_7G033974v2 [Setaria viridis]
MLHQMFQASIQVHLGDGNLGLFWIDHWLAQSSPCLLAPDRCNLITPRIKKSRTVAQAMREKQWIRDIARQATVTVISQYVQLWHVLSGVQLLTGVEDRVSWRWEALGIYSAKSAYKSFFRGTTNSRQRSSSGRLGRLSRLSFSCGWLSKIDYGQRQGEIGMDYRTVSNAHYANRILIQQPICLLPVLTPGRFGTQSPACCTFILSLLLQTKRYQTTGSSDDGGLIDLARRKGIDSMFMLIAWKIWKERNDRVYQRGTEKNPGQLTWEILDEAFLWCAGGARLLATLPWPHSGATLAVS